MSQTSSVALLFPGQGSQIVGMAKDFVENFKESALVFEEASDSTGVHLKKLCFDGPLSDLTLTENLQPALFTAEMAMFAALRVHTGITPSFAIGHSLGEYSALSAAGALSITDGAKLTRLRGQAMQKAVPVGKGTMAAILGLSAEVVVQLCKTAQATFAFESEEVVEPANFNAPGQVVIAGTVAGVQKACAMLKEDETFKGGKSIPLQVSAPFHCSLMRPAQEAMRGAIHATTFQAPSCTLVPNSTAQALQSHFEIPGALIDQIVLPVRWEQSMKLLAQHEIKTAWEIGPGKVLAGLNKRICPEMPVKNISSVELMKAL